MNTSASDIMRVLIDALSADVGDMRTDLHYKLLDISFD